MARQPKALEKAPIYEQQIRPEPSEFSELRRSVTARLRTWGCDEAVDAVALCLTELLANVARHTSSADCLLTLQYASGRVRAAVRDRESTRPVLRRTDLMSECGRGLFLLDATADAWGSEQVAGGKEVWFEVRTSGRVLR